MAAEAAALRRRVLELENSPLRRITAPLRTVAHRVLGVEPTSAIPDTPTHRGLALVLDHNWPQPDRDAGSVEIVNMVQGLHNLGFTTILAASEQHAGEQIARDRLVELGYRCLGPQDAPSVEAWLRVQGADLDLAMLCRVFCGGAFLEQIQRNSPKARLVFNSIDLNWVREQRRAQVTGDAFLAGSIEMLRTREQHVIRSCDATIVVSDAEGALLETEMPDCRVSVLPLARPIAPGPAGFAEREGFGFIGGFVHAPNEDAVRWFTSDIWSFVRRLLPDARMAIAGADPPVDLVSGAEGMTVLGHIPDVAPWFNSLRATVAPLRFGAGIKGKVASSLAAGVPCVATPMAVEGMGLGSTDGVVVAETPEEIAAALVQLHQDPSYWEAMRRGGLAYAGARLDFVTWQARLDALLCSIGL